MARASSYCSRPPPLIPVVSPPSRLQVNITVSQVPKIVDLVDKLNHPEGTNASFTCSIGSGDLTGLVYEWRKDDTLLSSTSQQRVRIITAPDNFQSVLRVMDLKPHDAGVYSCLARNKFGQDKIYTRLNVKGKFCAAR